MKILGVIPARYASTRFPGKAIVDIKGKSMLQRVYERASKSKVLDEVLIATEDQIVLDNAKSFGGNACLTRDDHASGTDRCYEALQITGEKYDYVINIQGDEPFIEPLQINELASCLEDNTELATLVKKITEPDELFNPSEVKAVFNKNKEALYFSRQPIPYGRDLEANKWLKKHGYYKHIGIYAYRTDILEEISKLGVSSLEQTESLEQLRWLEEGYKIKLAFTEYESVCIDTPEDLAKVLSEFHKYQ